MSSPDTTREYWEYNKKGDYFKPKYRYELIAWFKQNRPEYRVSSWPKRKLLAVFFRLMNNM